MQFTTKQGGCQRVIWGLLAINPLDMGQITCNSDTVSQPHAKDPYLAEDLKRNDR